MASLFRRDGNVFVPTPYTTGPWSSDAMHGGPPSALIGALASSQVEEGELVARVQIDLERPVPIEPLIGSVERRQVSRRIVHLRLQLETQAGEVVVGARALAMRTIEPPLETQPARGSAGPEAFTPVDWDPFFSPGQVTFVRDATEHRMVQGGYGTGVASTAWLRLVVPVIADEPDDPLAGLLGVADFGSALSMSGLVGEGLALINADVNVTLSRQPVGPWFRFESSSTVGPGGVGAVVAGIEDRLGPLGVATQSQIVRRYRAR